MLHFIPIFTFIILFIPILLFFTRNYNIQERVTISKILTAALIVRLGAVLVFALFIPLKSIAPDSIKYTQIGKTTAEYWNNKIPFNPSKNSLDSSKRTHIGYYYICAANFYIFGNFSPYIPAYFNSFLGVLTILLFITLIKDFFAWKIVYNVALLFSFFPSIILWNSFPLKDSIVFFLVIISFYSYIRFFQTRLPFYLLTSSFSLITLYFFRFYLVMVILAVLVITIFLMMGELSLSKIIKSIVGATLILLIVLSSSIGNKLVTSWQDNANVEQISKFQEGLSSGKSKITYGGEYKTGLDVIKYLPVRLIIFMFAPFPWQITSFNSAMTMIEMPLWWLMFPLWIKGFKFLLLHKHVRQFLPLILYTIFLTLLYSIVEGNIGTAYRMRAQVLPFFFVMAMVGWALEKTNKLNISNKFIFSLNLRNQI